MTLAGTPRERKLATLAESARAAGADAALVCDLAEVILSPPAPLHGATSLPPALLPLPPCTCSPLPFSLPFLSPSHPDHVRLAPAPQLPWVRLESSPMRQL